MLYMTIAVIYLWATGGYVIGALSHGNEPNPSRWTYLKSWPRRLRLLLWPFVVTAIALLFLLLTPFALIYGLSKCWRAWK